MIFITKDTAKKLKEILRQIESSQGNFTPLHASNQIAFVKYTGEVEDEPMGQVVQWLSEDEEWEEIGDPVHVFSVNGLTLTEEAYYLGVRFADHSADSIPVFGLVLNAASLSGDPTHVLFYDSSTGEVTGHNNLRFNNSTMAFYVGQPATFGMANFRSDQDNKVTVLAQGRASQTADIVQIQNSSSAVKCGVAHNCLPYSRCSTPDSADVDIAECQGPYLVFEAGIGG